MHDPSVVAWDLVLPIPVRGWKHNDARPGEYRWGIKRWRRTNEENLGEPVHPWWRPKGYRLRLAGRAVRSLPLGTIWHHEPGGRDALTVCGRNPDGSRKPGRGWAWHVHHWSFQWFFARRLRRFLFERCKGCGRRYPWGYAPVSHQWDEPSAPWFKVERRAYHHECSALLSLRQDRETHEQIIRELVTLLRAGGQDEADVIDWLSKGPLSEFRLHYKLERILGYERDGQYKLVRSFPR